MRQALGLAARARGRAAPNPMVGSVIARNGKVIARGYHHRAGEAHGEVDALQKLDMRAPGATVYVTLEPCNHTGRTGPCSEALIAAGVKRVVCGMLDPNPRVAGGGVERLRAAGIVVETGVLEAECRALNEAWIHFITTGRPLVTLKAALTLDGRLAARGGDSRWVSGEESRLEAHRLRDQADAILVGARTVEKDDPQLTTRLPNGKGKDPQRVILDGKLSLRANAKAVPGAWIFATKEAPERPELSLRGAEVVRVRGKDGRVDLRAMLEVLAKRGITSLLVEGGGEVHGQLIEAGLADRVALFLAPKLIGAGGVPFLNVPGPQKMASAFQLTGVSTRRLGDDIFVTGAVAQPDRNKA